MLQRAIFFCWGLFLLSQSSILSAYVGPPTLVPENPVSGSDISMILPFGECDGLLSDPPPAQAQVGNAITVTVYGILATGPLCNISPQELTHPVGSLSPGAYTLRVLYSYTDIGVPQPVVEIGTIEFSVAGAYASLPVSAVSWVGLALLALAIAVISRRFLARRHLTSLSFVFAIIAVSSLATANEPPPELMTIKVLLAKNSDSPTPEEIIEYLSNAENHESPPLDAFRVVKPVSATFLLPERAGGNLLRAIEDDPESSRAKLERYLVVRYPEGTNMIEAVTLLREDRHVLGAFQSEFVELNSSAASITKITRTFPMPYAGTFTQYGRDQLNMTAAWQLASGYAVVGLADTGLAVNHPGFKQFSALGQYLGGNFIFGLDVGRWTQISNVTDPNVDEQEPEPAPINNLTCNPSQSPTLAPTYAGHGTHTAGLVAVNANSGLGLLGTCKNCGIQMFRVGYAVCSGSDFTVTTSFDSWEIANTFMSQLGTQVTNMSFGTNGRSDGYCYLPANLSEPHCLSLDVLDTSGILSVASSGNDRKRLNYPASDGRAIAAGGLDSSGSLWDDWPSCPSAYSGGRECGSNYTVVSGQAQQELVAAAKSVISTVYPNKEWNPWTSCGDSFGTPIGDGVGDCTGTSMSAPLISGLAGVLRSINPLVLPGTPTATVGQPWGVRTVLASTTDRAQASLGWIGSYGYGVPDGEAAARKVLGTVRGVTVKNRVSPLFGFYSSLGTDYANTISPQFALAIWMNSLNNYISVGASLPFTYSFPSNLRIRPSPAADAYVLTTEYSPFTAFPSLVPLYQVIRSRFLPLGCTPPSCTNVANRDFTLMTNFADLEQAHADGYVVSSIQGYIFAPCPEGGKESSCMPPGTEPFYRACKIADDDCATFLEGQRLTFESDGYLTAYPAGSSKLLGYAYPSDDKDNDGLVDGMELVIGTDPANADTDGDGIDDGVEFPQDGISHSDPCINNITSINYCP